MGMISWFIVCLRIVTLHVRQTVTIKPINKVIVILAQRKEQHVPPSLPHTSAPSPPPDMHTCQVIKFSSPLSTTED